MPNYTSEYQKNLEAFINAVKQIEIPKEYSVSKGEFVSKAKGIWDDVGKEMREMYRRKGNFVYNRGWMNNDYIGEDHPSEDYLDTSEAIYDKIWKKLDIYDGMQNMGKFKHLFDAKKAAENPNYIMDFELQFSGDKEVSSFYNDLQKKLDTYYSDKEAQKPFKENKKLAAKLYKLAEIEEELKIRKEAMAVVRQKERMADKMKNIDANRTEVSKKIDDFRKKYPDFHYQKEKKKLENLKKELREMNTKQMMGGYIYDESESIKQMEKEVRVLTNRVETAEKLYQEYRNVTNTYARLISDSQKAQGKNKLTESIEKRMKSLYAHVNDAKKKDHKDSKEYERIIRALEASSKGTAGIEEIRELKDAAEKYKIAKGKVGLFPSEQRVTRLNFADKLISFCKVCEQTLNIPEVANSPYQKEINEFCQKKEVQEFAKLRNKEEFWSALFPEKQAEKTSEVKQESLQNKPSEPEKQKEEAAVLV